MENKESILIEKERPANPVFYRDKGSLLLEIEPDESSIAAIQGVAGSEGLSRKNKFHITLIGRETGEIILEKIKNLSPEEQERILSEIEVLSRKFDWKYSLGNEYYFISKTYQESGDKAKEERKSIIQLIEFPNLAPFYDELNKLLGTNFDLPFPHVTLFSTSTREDMKLRGIGLYSKFQFESLNPKKIIPITESN